MSNNIETILDQLGLIYKRNEDIDSIMIEIEGPKPTTAPPKQAPTPVPALSSEQQAKISLFKKLFYNNMKDIQYGTPYPIDTDGKYIGTGFDCDGTQLKFGDSVKIIKKEGLHIPLKKSYRIEIAEKKCTNYIPKETFISNDDYNKLKITSEIVKEMLKNFASEQNYAIGTQGFYIGPEMDCASQTKLEYGISLQIEELTSDNKKYSVKTSVFKNKCATPIHKNLFISKEDSDLIENTFFKKSS